jgi:D-threo-aldose 1-dehydrogenase
MFHITWGFTSARYDYGPVPGDVLERSTRIARVCEQFGVDLPTAAVSFAGRHPAVVRVVVGLRTPAHVRDLVARWERPVPEGLWAALGEQGLVAPRTARDLELPGPQPCW